MAAKCDVKETTISDLPSEILCQIFTYLPNNIKVLRLVCSKWNELCNIEKLSGHQKLVTGSRQLSWLDGFPFSDDFYFPMWENVDKPFSRKTLLRSIYHLDLRFITFTTDHVPFFKKHCGKLRSLALLNCGADEHVPFFQFCEELNALIVHDSSQRIVRLFRCPDGSFVQTNIVSLEMGNCDKWSDEITDACIRLCPNLRSLSVVRVRLTFSPQNEKRIYSFKDGEERVFNRRDIFSFECLRHALSIRAASLVELRLELVGGLTPKRVDQIVSIPNLKLQKLTLCGIGLQKYRTICNIATLQPHLQSITIRRCRGIHLNGAEDWIEKCSNLTRLEIDTANNLPVVFDQKLLASQLRELVLKTCASEVIGSVFLNHRGTFDHLHTLEFSSPDIDYDCVLRVVPRHLRHLSLSHTRSSDQLCEALEFVSNRFTILETLTLAFDRGSSARDFEVLHSCEGISSWNLTSWRHKPQAHSHFDDKMSNLFLFIELKTLRLTGFFYGFTCSPDLLRRIKAPNLLSLELDGYGEINSTALRAMVENHPSLECLKKSVGIFVRSNPLNLRTIRNWKRLNFFYDDGYEDLRLHRRKENYFDQRLRTAASQTQSFVFNRN